MKHKFWLDRERIRTQGANGLAVGLGYHLSPLPESQTNRQTEEVERERARDRRERALCLSYSQTGQLAASRGLLGDTRIRHPILSSTCSCGVATLLTS